MNTALRSTRRFGNGQADRVPASSILLLKVPAQIEAAWLHHAFTQIHPFQDGNGRVARALASLVFIKNGFFPLVVSRDDRIRYIEALEASEAGASEELIGLFSKIQKRSLTKAIGHAADDQACCNGWRTRLRR